MTLRGFCFWGLRLTGSNLPVPVRRLHREVTGSKLRRVMNARTLAQAI
jgi:hypothetical protein